MTGARSPGQGLALVNQVEHGVQGHLPLEALQTLQTGQVAQLDLAKVSQETLLEEREVLHLLQHHGVELAGRHAEAVHEDGEVGQIGEGGEEGLQEAEGGVPLDREASEARKE